MVELSEKYGLSAMTMDDISAEVKAVRNEKRNTKIVTPREFWELTINNLSLNKCNHHFFD